MESCAKDAMKASRLGSDGETTPQLFTVQEAEAAALVTIQSRSYGLKAGITVLVIDAGGGTTDLGAYRLKAASPLRLESEVSETSNESIGSRHLNEALRAFARSQLQQSAKEIEYAPDISLQWIIKDRIIKEFERESKRTFKIQDRMKTFRFHIPGLKASDTNPRLRRNQFIVDYDDMLTIFRPALKKIATLMRRQIENARDIRQPIDTVVLTGGFGDSPALQKHFEDTLESINRAHGTNLKLNRAPANAGATAVAHGALERSLDKTNGPKRLPQMSIGHDVSICIADKEHYPDSAVFNQKAKRSKLDHEYYIMNTIKWRIKRGQGELESRHKVEFDHVFLMEPTQRVWTATLDIYGSDTCTKDFYTKAHSKNKGKTFQLGNIAFDLNQLRQDVVLYEPAEHEEDGRPRYKITLRVELAVIDRNLTCQAMWTDAAGTRTHLITGTRQPISMLTAFKPGTA